MKKSLAVVLSGLLLPFAVLADNACPSHSFIDTGDYSINFRSGEVVEISLSKRTISMFMKDNGALVSTTASIEDKGTTLIHRVIETTRSGIGIAERIGASIQIFPDGRTIAIQPADPTKGIVATTIAYDGFSIPACLKGNKRLEITDSHSLITSELAPGEFNQRVTEFEDYTGGLSLALDLSKAELRNSQTQLAQCEDALGLSQTKVAGLESEVAIFDVNNKYSRVSFSKSLRRISSSLSDINGQDSKAYKTLVRAINKIKRRNERGLFERPALSANN